MIEPNLPVLSVGKQCALLSISRSSFYYEPKGETEKNLDLMRLIDKQFLETPFFGVRQMTWHLRNEDHLVNEKRIRRLMRLMGPLSADCCAIACPVMDPAWIPVSGGDYGLAHPKGSGLADIEHAGGGLDLSRFCIAASARLSDFPFESDGAFSSPMLNGDGVGCRSH